MVKVIFKLSEVDPVELKIHQPQPLQALLEKCSSRAGISLGGYIAVRNGKVVAADKMVDNNDIIEVFPALSGG